jgi:Zn-dependent M16 (insulinase) family peptidase
VEKYGACGDFLRGFAGQVSDFTGFIIGAVANSSPLLTPKTKAQVGDRFHFSRTSWETRCQVRNQLLNTTAEQLTAAADLLDKTLSQGGLCIVGGQAQLDKCEGLEEVITL